MIFQNANIKRLIITNKPKEGSKLQFKILTPGLNGGPNVSALNSRIESLEILFSQIKYLDSTVLNPYVFANMKKFVYDSDTSDLNVQDTLFAPFKSLKEFTFRVPSMKDYIRNQNLTWALSLNADVKIDLNDQAQLQDPTNRDEHFKLTISDVTLDYDFPEEDFCLYRNFPHSQLVFPIINSKPDLACSCSLIWLLQYSAYYKNPAEMNTTSVRKCFSGPRNFTELFKQCNFAEKILYCDVAPGQCEYLPEVSYLNCSNIVSINEVNGDSAPSIETLFIRPRLPVTLDSSLNLAGFETKLKDNYQVYLQNFKAFNFLENPFKELRKSGNLLYLEDMNLDFTLTNEFELSSNCIFWSALDYIPLFASFEALFFQRSVKYVDRVCPLVFQNSNIKRFVLNGLTANNTLTFLPIIGNNIDGTGNVSVLNSNVESLEIYQSSLRSLDRSLLNP